ncbi:MAG: cytochrome ubiquinol oxidase subunit I [Candidatus Korarchaeum sp.]|nr:cytochrome ubiquinol oxidase subunit I [Candidatus Korarchaeum sp.]MDW8035430.1 cytochrome ubiquinol oxidase subunit I [Candidatus Korarchaeum sp.]
MIPQVYYVALVFGIHIVAVNLGIALSTMIPFLKRRADLSGNARLDDLAKRIFRVYAATYALAGVMGTAFTVFLLSFYPEFIGIAGNITLVPFAIAIMSILVHFLAIVLYYYGWDSFPRNLHLASGILLALTSYTIPLGFRLVFSFLNIPVGLKFDGKPYIDAFEALLNPTFAPLYLKSILGALTFGSLFIVTLATFNLMKGGSSEEKSLYSISLNVAFVSMFLMLLLGPWYAMSLISTPIKFDNIFRSFGWSVSGASGGPDLGWLFAIKLTLIIVQVYVLLNLTALRDGKPLPKQFRLALLATLSAALTVLSGEYLNMFSQYPFFLANLPLIISQVPEPWRKILGKALSLENVNPLSNDPSLLIVTAIGILILLIAIGYFLYLVFFKKGPLIE